MSVRMVLKLAKLMVVWHVVKVNGENDPLQYTHQEDSKTTHGFVEIE